MEWDTHVECIHSLTYQNKCCFCWWMSRSPFYVSRWRSNLRKLAPFHWNPWILIQLSYSQCSSDKMHSGKQLFSHTIHLHLYLVSTLSLFPEVGTVILYVRPSGAWSGGLGLLKISVFSMSSVFFYSLYSVISLKWGCVRILKHIQYLLRLFLIWIFSWN